MQARKASEGDTQEVRRLLERLRFLVYFSPLRQRQIEKRARFSRGYLSQLLCGNIDLKFQHLVRILNATEVAPSTFFSELYPAAPSALKASLQRFRHRSEPLDPSFRMQLLRLYGLGLESLADLSERLERCEDVFSELETLGVLRRDRSR